MELYSLGWKFLFFKLIVITKEKKIISFGKVDCTRSDKDEKREVYSENV